MILTHFYPRSPCGERPHAKLTGTLDYSISIHALLAESDIKHRHKKTPHLIFLSTLSLRRATRNIANSESQKDISIHALLAESDNSRADNVKRNEISIHALLAESDYTPLRGARPIDYFYPRSPCGERQRCKFGRNNRKIFLSTLSLRRATRTPPYNLMIHQKFLSTLSLRRATSADCNYRSAYRYFYPRSPCGERPCQNGQLHGICHFYPRSPCGERH